MTDASAALVVNRFCGDIEGILNLCWTEINLSVDYDFIPIIHEGEPSTDQFSEYNEENFFTNIKFVSLHDDAYVSGEVDTDGDGEACVVIEPTELPLNDDVSFGGIFIKKGSTPPPTCPNIAVDFDFEIITTTNGTTKTKISYDLSPLTDADILQVEVSAILAQSGQQINYSSGDATNEQTWNIINGGNFNWFSITMSVEITISTGCTYSIVFFFNLANTDGNTDTFVDPSVPPN